MSIKMHLRGNMNLPQYIHLDNESQYSEREAINILTIRARKLPKPIIKAHTFCSQEDHDILSFDQS